ncbi:MAG: hypothetical protein U0X91_16690 [Spirosomataceae bacterium]
MKKQFKKLELKKEYVMNLSTMKQIKGGLTMYCNYTKLGPEPTQWGTTLLTEPTINAAQGATAGC